ncbi:hypothetical protein THIARS_80208 [Thiomonas delicata]|uniref:Uncharacterized protein n=1 Tax=Thiomonas delicata TaxID=364030 RepID=A0A238D971_THIDL|nr:hypothetical protein THIARS_80208 [Thiomonas delicata]
MMGKKSNRSFMPALSLFALRGSMPDRREIERCGVDAVAQACRARAIGEDMAEMGMALGATHLRAQHAVTVVFHGLDGLLPHRLREAGPAAAGIELGGGVEQHRAAAHAAVAAVGVVVPVLAAERGFGGAAARHTVLLGGELGAPLGVVGRGLRHGVVSFPSEAW